jgi:RND family efflux transporter MFP subunit
MIPFRWLSPVLVALLGTVGCGGNKAPLAPPEPPVVTVTRPEVRDLDSVTEFTGRLAAMETQEVRAQVTGYLKEIKFTDGALVMEGQALYEIEPEPYDAALANATAMVAKATSDFTTADKQLALAKRDYDRLKAIGTSVSAQELDKAKNAFDTAESTLASVKASVDSARAMEKKAKFDRANCTIRCEVKGSGMVTRTEITKGNLVQAGQTLLCRVTSLDPIYVYFDVDEDTSLQYRRRIFIDKTLPNPRSETKLQLWVGTKDETRNADGKWPHTGEVNYVAPEIIRGLGTREVRGSIANPDHRLTPGDSVRVQVTSGANEKLMLVPEIAIGSQQQQKFVYVIAEKDGKSIAEFRPVVVGPVREIEGVRMQVIRSGLAPTDRFVVNGVLRVRPGAEVKPTEQPLIATKK